MRYKRTVYGRFMYNLTFKISKFLMKHMWLYYVLNYTWGLLFTFVGWIIYGFVKLFLRKKIVTSGKFGPSYYIMLGNNWGGLEIGKNFLLADGMGPSWNEHTMQHECGHTFQNAILGPLYIFLVFIPSVIRYWVYTTKTAKHIPTKDYDAIWFEGSATDIGYHYYVNYLIDKK